MKVAENGGRETMGSSINRVMKRRTRGEMRGHKKKDGERRGFGIGDWGIIITMETSLEINDWRSKGINSPCPCKRFLSLVLFVIVFIVSGIVVVLFLLQVKSGFSHRQGSDIVDDHLSDLSRHVFASANFGLVLH